MTRYKNDLHKFEIELPDEWRGPGLISRLFGMDANPEFYGPNRSSLKFAIGHISPEPSIKQQQLNLERIATKYGHSVEEVGSIAVYGKEHATIVCGIPSTSPGSPMPVAIPHERKYIDRGTKFIVPSPYYVPHMMLKSYSLIFDGIEYFATASIDGFPKENFDEIIKTFRLL